MTAASELPGGTVTFLFTDIEGSTRLLEELGRELYGELLARHNQLLRAAFATSGGIEVDRQGDAFFAVFRSAGSAVAAAVEAQRALANEGWPNEVQVRVRMGLDTGEAALREDSYVGLAVHVAARVAAAARGGQVLVTSTTAKIVERDLPSGATLRDLGERFLTGLERPERLAALELDDLPHTVSVEAPPGHAAVRAQSPLLERDAEVAALRALVDAARDGNGRLVAIEGSAGIGKTRLLGEVRVSADAMGLRVLSARGGELEREFAFGLVRQLFEPLLASVSSEARKELLAGSAGLAAPLFIESAPGEPPPTGDAAFAILHGLYWLAANIALGRPTLLLVDDIHWGDAPSLRWLAFVARRLEGLALVLAVGSRPPQQSEQEALLTELLSDPAAVLFRPGSLGVESVAILARDVFSAEPDPVFCAACAEATGGNPLYLRALLITLAAAGVEPTAESSAHVEEVGPEPVARAVSLRLSRLPPAAEALAQAIAVLGQAAELGLAASLAGLDRSAAVEAAAALVRAELLRPGLELDFAHPVVRAAVYESIGIADRTDAHRRAARLLADAGAEPEQTASHLLLIPPEADPFAVAILRDAARRALSRGAPDASVTYLRRALAEMRAGEERSETLAELGVAERGVDVAASIEHLGEAVELIDDPVRHAEVALQYGLAQMYVNADPVGTVKLLRGALDRLEGGSSELSELIEAMIMSTALGGDPEQYPTAREQISGLDESSLSGGLGTDIVLATLAHFEMRQGADRARTIALAERSIASGRIERTAGYSLYYPPNALGVAGEVVAATAFYDRAVGHARRGGDLLTLAGLLGFRGSLATEQGELLSAEQDLREGFELSKQNGVAGSVLYSAAWLAEFLVERGALGEAEAILGELGLPEQVPVSMHFIFFLTARGRLRLAQRKAESALEDFLAIGRIANAVEIHNPAFRPWRAHAAAAQHALGRDGEARELATEELGLARRWGSPRTIGVSLGALALASPPADRERLLREAVEVLAASPSRLEHARALVDLGAALRRGKSRSDARDVLRQGVELAQRCGAAPLAERGNEELAATGARPRKILVSGLASLTASERRVAQLAAEGLSNKDIAQALFVTVKTVEVHLSNVYRKLEIGSRHQLAGALVAEHAVVPVPAVT
jgi:class 3 adenylate cyclase/DNA-binding CsgD family transcriptional regulator